MLRRINKLREYLSENKIDAAFISFQHNVYYFSGFTGGDDARLIITADKQYIITDSRYTFQVAEQCPGFIAEITSALNRNSISTILEKENIRTLLFENMSVMYSEYKLLSDISCEKGIELREFDYFIEKTLRNYKDSDEISRIKKACAIAEESFI